MRIDALRALGQQSELLALLDTKRLATFPRAAELRVLRGQLRAAAHRCNEAAADLGDKPSVADQRLLQACQLRSAQGN